MVFRHAPRWYIWWWHGRLCRHQILGLCIKYRSKLHVWRQSDRGYITSERIPGDHPAFNSISVPSLTLSQGQYILMRLALLDPLLTACHPDATQFFINVRLGCILEEEQEGWRSSDTVNIPFCFFIWKFVLLDRLFPSLVQYLAASYLPVRDFGLPRMFQK